MRSTSPHRRWRWNTLGVDADEAYDVDAESTPERRAEKAAALQRRVDDIIARRAQDRSRRRRTVDFTQPQQETA